MATAPRKAVPGPVAHATAPEPAKEDLAVGQDGDSAYVAALRVELARHRQNGADARADEVEQELKRVVRSGRTGQREQAVNRA